jgi:hypothetical protein
MRKRDQGNQGPDLTQMPGRLLASDGTRCHGLANAPEIFFRKLSFIGLTDSSDSHISLEPSASHALHHTSPSTQADPVVVLFGHVRTHWRGPVWYPIQSHFRDRKTGTGFRE